MDNLNLAQPRRNVICRSERKRRQENLIGKSNSSGTNNSEVCRRSVVNLAAKLVI